MPIRSIKKLPVPAQRMYEEIVKKLQSDGRDEKMSNRIGWEVVKKHFAMPTTTKSVAFKQSYVNNTENFIDVLLGYSTLDKHGEILADSFWANKPMHPISGDMEHIHDQKAQGLLVDYPEEWEGFVPMADQFYHKDGQLWAKVDIPSQHPFTPTFLKNWESGKYGVSIEYSHPDEAVEYTWVDGQLVPVIVSGTITGFTFTEDPAIDTNIKKNE